MNHQEDLEAAKGWLAIAKENNNKIAIQILERFFPELRESEDEKIRKAQLDYWRSVGGKEWYGVPVQETITWLERQSERAIPKNVDDAALQYVDTCAVDGEITHDNIIEPYWNHHSMMNAYKAGWLEKQAKQKPIDESKPKFKVGDWITTVNDDGGIAIEKVVEFPGNKVRLIDTDGVYMLCPQGLLNHYHLWTIQDAKDGDILYLNDNTIVIFKDLYDSTTFHSYCHIEDDVFSIMPEWWEDKGFQPATKEQRDLLFQKMKEASYEWNAEKKELKKIEQTSAWSEEDKKELEQLLDILHANEYESFDNWLKSLKDRVQPQPKQGEQKTATQYNYVKFREGDTVQKIIGDKDIVTIAEVDIEAEVYRLTNTGFIPFKYEHLWRIVEQKFSWSEDDEEKFRDVIRLVEQGAPVQSIRDHYTNWLKSLKDRFQLQPKQEWSEEDEEKLQLLIAMCDETKGDSATYSMMYHEMEELKTWLKSLKDKVQPQSKQEWSEKDNHILKNIYDFVKENTIDPNRINCAEECLNWLELLKPQNRWKPNEEQMNALDKAKNSPANYYNIRLGLQSLYNDLLKL